MSEFVACPCQGGTLDRLIQPAILVVLAGGPLHGYRLVERIGALPGFAGQKPDASGVYRFLKAMEGRELVASAWDVSASGPAKKSYQITPAGQQCLAPMDRHAGELSARNQWFAGGRPQGGPSSRRGRCTAVSNMRWPGLVACLPRFCGNRCFGSLASCIVEHRREQECDIARRTAHGHRGTLHARCTRSRDRAGTKRHSGVCRIQLPRRSESAERESGRNDRGVS